MDLKETSKIPNQSKEEKKSKALFGMIFSVLVVLGGIYYLYNQKSDMKTESITWEIGADIFSFEVPIVEGFNNPVVNKFNNNNAVSIVYTLDNSGLSPELQATKKPMAFIFEINYSIDPQDSTADIIDVPSADTENSHGFNYTKFENVNKWFLGAITKDDIDFYIKLPEEESDFGFNVEEVYNIIVESFNKTN